MHLQSWKNFLISPVTKSTIVHVCEREEGEGRKEDWRYRGEEGRGREGMERGEKGEGWRQERGAPPSSNPGYAHHMRSTYGKMTYAYCTYVSGKITYAPYVRWSHLGSNSR